MFSVYDHMFRALLLLNKTISNLHVNRRGIIPALLKHKRGNVMKNQNTGSIVLNSALLKALRKKRAQPRRSG